MRKKLRILVVHSSAELYGSDRSLLDFVRHRGASIQVTVALPESGLLVQELEAAGATVVIGEVCKIQRNMFSFNGLLRIFKTMYRSIKFLGKSRKNGNFDIVYSNTVAVLGGALCARLWRVPHVWHVREIAESSRLLTFGFRHLVSKLSSTVVCNSGRTRDWIFLEGKLNKYKVVWNGFDLPDVLIDRAVERDRLGVGPEDILFVLVGRINSWKGHSLLVKAFSSLPSNIRSKIHVAFVGSAFAGQEHFERDLTLRIKESGVENRMHLIPYRKDIESIWSAADVVVVPSTEPEPFGRVAIEAMAFGRPVIASAHGGLIEIVADGETGRLIPPRDYQSLAVAMAEMVGDPDLRQRMGEAGFLRQKKLFSVNGYATQLIEIMHSTAIDSYV